MSAGPPPDRSPEWQRLQTVSTLVDVLVGDEDITDLAPLTTGAGLPAWIGQLPVEPGWQVLTPRPGTRTALARVAVCGVRGDGGFDGTETLTVFAFTGVPCFPQMVRNAACALRDLDANDVTTRVLSVPPGPGRLAMRSSGVFTVAGRRIWGQCSFYSLGSDQPHHGRLIEHHLFIDAAQRDRLRGDIDALTDAVHRGFVTDLTAGDSLRRDG